jgi:FAD:protein FMN transferase
MKKTVAALLVFSGGAVTAPSARYEFASRQMGTSARIVVFASTEEAAGRAAAAAFARIDALDAVMSDYRDDSELAALCRTAGMGPVRISEDLFRVLEVSQRVAADSRGAFDATVGAVTRVWRRARRLGELPDAAQIRSAHALTGSARLILDVPGRTADLREPGMRLDLGGIGKGFAADEAAAVLKRHGITRALVAIGGDIVAMDAPPGLAGWTVGVDDLPGEQMPRSILLHDGAVSTSGDAEQWVELGGVRYSHIIDPRTGTPLTGRRSVTVVAPTGALSDAMATAVSVLGPREGLALIDRTPGAAATISMAVGDKVQTQTSSGWVSWLKRENGHRPRAMDSFWAAAHSSSRCR